jgi:rhodanese-related sulfurtransferase
MDSSSTVKIITKEELRKKIDHGEEFKLVDVRDTPDYQREHIVGAVHLLISEMNQERLEGMFDKDDLIITYSLDRDCPAKIIAAEKLVEFGYTDVLAYEGSWKEWKKSGYPVE